MIWLSLHLWGSTSRGKHPGKWGRVWVRGEEKRNKYVVAAQCQHQGETSQEFCLYQTHCGADLTRICQQKCGCCRLGLVQHQSSQHLLLQILFWDIHSYKVCSCHSTMLHKRKQSNWNARCTRPHPLGGNDWKKLWTVWGVRWQTWVPRPEKKRVGDKAKSAVRWGTEKHRLENRNTKVGLKSKQDPDDQNIATALTDPQSTSATYPGLTGSAETQRTWTCPSMLNQPRMHKQPK